MVRAEATVVCSLYRFAVSPLARQPTTCFFQNDRASDIGARFSAITSDVQEWGQRTGYGKDRLRRVSHFDSGGDLLGSEEYWYDAHGQRTQTVKRDNLGNKTENGARKH